MPSLERNKKKTSTSPKTHHPKPVLTVNRIQKTLGNIVRNVTLRLADVRRQILHQNRALLVEDSQKAAQDGTPKRQVQIPPLALPQWAGRREKAPIHAEEPVLARFAGAVRRVQHDLQVLRGEKRHVDQRPDVEAHRRGVQLGHLGEVAEDGRWKDELGVEERNIVYQIKKIKQKIIKVSNIFNIM